jgi:HlyD family secretion protein
MKKKLMIGGGSLVVLIIAYFVVFGGKKGEVADIIVPVAMGTFQVDIETSGELEAKNSVKIMGPSQLRNFRINQLTISNIIDEGTVVRKGEWIATLDRSEFNGRIQDKQIEFDKIQSQFIQIQLDTTLQMRQARDELINLRYAVEEQEIVLEQSKFEPPATIKQAEINLGKAKRTLQQATENYKIKQRQNRARMQEVTAELRKVQNEMREMQELVASFNIIATEPGMVIYAKGWDGRPIKAGSQISTWDPTVATLPDLSVMISKTFVNEVDVRKVKPGQAVEIGLDAFPEKRLRGRVITVANVGEQRPNSDAKVFQVVIQISGSDPLLKPAMTTSNKIIASVLDSVRYVPLEALRSLHDSITYVMKREGLNIVKQEVEVGETNTNHAVIVSGLKEGDRVYLSNPAKMDDKPVVLIPEMDGKRMRKEEEQTIDIPQERMITLPDGRQVPASMMQNRQGGAPNGNGAGATTGGTRQGGQRQGSRPAGGGTQPAN